MGPVKTSGQDSLERAVREAGIEVRPVWFDEVGSTNDEVRRLAGEGAAGWTVVAAGHQSAGRGRLGRSWMDAPGKALLFSVLVRPAREAEHAPLLGLTAAVEMIASVGSPAMKAKWPNDLMIEGRKVGGILSEASLDQAGDSYAVIGVGLNLTMTDEELPPAVRTGATSLLLEGIPVGPGVREGLLSRFLRGFRRRSQLPASEMLKAYRGVCATLGRRVRATTVRGERIDGTAQDIDDHGALIVGAAGRHHRVVFADVAHLD